ncbi:hypothetical protein QFZ81_001024 [Paenibacillus sp. V4I9]|uniref:hypothetical protein n=1 Tax=Paenibacillus sp. V4I9 TaxID=3042308 RepID=UPI00277E8241|nr:hypothetical protein [Paenibacillus sp. V4I9]MDQ0885936.1 hypothetical protein [Paenibacillus sp. V4I9]
MMKNRINIKTDEQLQNCIIANMEVEVWFAGMLDSVSKITAFDDEVVVVEDGKYLRGNCVMRIKASHLRAVK